MPMPRTILATGRALYGALLIGLGVLAASGPAEAQVQAEQQGDFRRFVDGLWPEARARGVSRTTFEEAFQGVAPDPKIIALTKKQSEFVRPIWEYINGAVSSARLERGRQLAAHYGET